LYKQVLDFTIGLCFRLDILFTTIIR